MRIELLELEVDPAAGGPTAGTGDVAEPTPPPAADIAGMTALLEDMKNELDELRAERAAPAAEPIVAAPAIDTAAPKVLQPQFGSVEQPAGNSVPAISDEGGFVSAKPLLTIGSFGKDVLELAALLDHHGYPNAQHAGKAEAILDDGLMGLVRVFQDANGHDPAKPSDANTAPLVRKDHHGIVDATTWKLLLGEAPAVMRAVRHVVEAVA